MSEDPRSSVPSGSPSVPSVAHLSVPSVAEPRFCQAEISAAFAAARESGREEGERMLLALRARQVARDIDATSFEPPVPVVCLTYFHERR